MVPAEVVITMVAGEVSTELAGLGRVALRAGVSPFAV
jgi:hypothetical protein